MGASLPTIGITEPHTLRTRLSDELSSTNEETRFTIARRTKVMARR